MPRPRKAKKERHGAAWLITFTDMMTLMLTFFILLVSMSVIDERRRLIVLGSIIGTFGVTVENYELMSRQVSRRTVEPGPIELENIEDLEPLKSLLWEDFSEDLEFSSNRFVQVLSINADVLFEPGELVLKPEGRRLMERILPVLLQIEYPLLLAGHTSTLRDEMGVDYRVEEEEETLDDSWPISLGRVQSVYRYLLGLGMDPESIRVEAYGKYRPLHSAGTAERRRRNRRVDIVLDKRNTQWLDKVGVRSEEVEEPFVYKDFIFEVDEEEGQ